MSNFNFATVNVTYILEAKRMIKEDRSIAKILLRLSDEMILFIESIDQDQLNIISQLKAPLPTLQINQKTIRELKKALENTDALHFEGLNDRLLTVNA